MAVKLTPAQAAALGIDVKQAKRTTRKEASGPYMTQCRTCGEVFNTRAAEDRHVVETHHARYELIL
jgi:hypothetical protein